MKIHDATAAPNPRRVRIFIAEKGIEVPYEQVDIVNAINRGEEFRTHKNPMGTVPVLELDDGTCIAESGAICRYFEELHPDPPLMGVDAQDKAIVEMWNRRMEFELFQPATLAFQQQHAVLQRPRVPGAGVCRGVKRKGGKESGLAGRSISRPPIHCGRALHRSRHCRPVRGGFWPGSKNYDPAGSKKYGSLARSRIRPAERQGVDNQKNPLLGGVAEGRGGFLVTSHLVRGRRGQPTVRM